MSLPLTQERRPSHPSLQPPFPPLSTHRFSWPYRIPSFLFSLRKAKFTGTRCQQSIRQRFAGGSGTIEVSLRERVREGGGKADGLRSPGELAVYTATRLQELLRQLDLGGITPEVGEQYLGV